MRKVECDCGEQLDAAGACPRCDAIGSRHRLSEAERIRRAERDASARAQRITMDDRLRTAAAVSRFDSDFAGRRARGQRLAAARHRGAR